MSFGTLGTNPSSITIPDVGTSNEQEVVITETNYDEDFIVTVPFSYQSIVSVSATQTGTYGTSCLVLGPSGSFWVQELASGSLEINVSGG
jgi:hypothetical protein